MSFNDILAEGGANGGGLTDHLYIVAVEDVDEVALAALATPGDNKTVATPIPLKANKKFAKFYFTKGLDAKLSYPLVGERDGKVRDVMIDVKQPRLIAANEVIIDEMATTPSVIICRDAEGQLRLVGIQLRKDGKLAMDFPAFMETDDAGTGGAIAEKKGHAFQWKSESSVTPLFYTGAIDLDEAT